MKHTVDILLEIISTNKRIIIVLVEIILAKFLSYEHLFMVTCQHLQKLLWKQVTNMPNFESNTWIILGNVSKNALVSKGNSTRYNNFNKLFKIIILLA